MKFPEAQRQMADMIREGGLRQPKGASQSPETMWNSLVEVNELGIITIDSQPGSDRTERAYIHGFMMEAHALRYIQALNSGSDMVALLIRPVKEWMPSTVVVTRTKTHEGGTRIPLYMGPETYDHLKTEFGGQGTGAGLDKSVKAVLVCTFDPRWGRLAMKKGGLIQCMKRALVV